MSCFNTLGFYCNVTSIKIVSNRGIGCREFNPNSQHVRNKNKENTRKKKKITRTRQYLRNSAICLHPWSCRDLSGKNTKYGYSFSLSQKHGNHTQKTLIAQLCFTHKTGPKIFPGLSLSKFLIKNYATLFGSDRVVKSDQIKLCSTKPNIGVTNSTKDRSPSSKH